MELKQKVDALPHHPGVYLMKEKRGEVLYIGKAKDLSDRVRSYFRSGADLTPKIESMVSQVADLEYIVTVSNL